MNVREEGETYKCNIYGNLFKVLKVGGGELVCCEKQMTLI